MCMFIYIKSVSSAFLEVSFTIHIRSIKKMFIPFHLALLLWEIFSKDINQVCKDKTSSIAYKAKNWKHSKYLLLGSRLNKMHVHKSGFHVFT